MNSSIKNSYFDRQARDTMRATGLDRNQSRSIVRWRNANRTTPKAPRMPMVAPLWSEAPEMTLEDKWANASLLGCVLNRGNLYDAREHGWFDLQEWLAERFEGPCIVDEVEE